MNKVYNDTKLCGNAFIREFNKNINPQEFIWYKDKYNRIIIPLEENDWFIQLDNELPQNINKKIFIQKETFHRLIKGKTNLKIKILELKK